jgi:hypothetical protein
MLVTSLNQKLAKGGDLTFSEIKEMINQLSKVANKRFYQVFKIVESHPDLIKTIIAAYSRLHKPSSSAKETHQEIHDLLSLLLIHYH